MVDQTKKRKISLPEALAARGIGSGLSLIDPQGRKVDVALTQVHYYKTGIKKGQVRYCSFGLPESPQTQAAVAAAKLGAQGGKARAENLTKKRISEIGRLGARARWAKNGRARRGFVIMVVPKAGVEPGGKMYVRTSRKNPTLAVLPFKDNDCQMVYTQAEAASFRTEAIARSVIKNILKDIGPNRARLVDCRVIEVA